MKRTVNLSVLFLGVFGLFLTAGGQGAEGAWSVVGGSETGNTVPLAAGGVTGKVGILTAFSHLSSGTGITTTGAVGATWTGSQYQHADDVKSATITLVHKYNRDSSGAATLSFSLTGTATVSGVAHRLNASDPSWWWNSENQVDEWMYPEAYDALGNVIAVSPTYTVDSPTSACAGDDGFSSLHSDPRGPSSNNNESTVPPSSTSTYTPLVPLNANGNTAGTVGLPDVPGAKMSLFVFYSCHARGCVDNASVSQDELKVQFTLSSNI